MDKKAKIRFIVISAVIFFLGLSFVYGSQIVASFSDKDTSKIELKKQKNITITNFYPVKVYDYLDKSTNSKFKVQIIEFGSEDKLDSWMRNKVEKSFKKEIINGNILFIDQYKNYAFWKSSNTNFIQIISIKYDKLTKESLKNNLKEEGSGVFPQELLEEYLLQYPSDCLNDECLNRDKELDKKIGEDLKWFNDPPKDIQYSDDYSVDDYCPINEEGWRRLKDSPAVDESELQELREHCAIYGSYKSSNGSLLSSSLKICGKEIDSYLNENSIYIYDDEETLNECSLRERFLEEHSEYLQEETDLFIEKRDEFILKEIQFLIELENKMNSKVLRDDIDKSIEKKYEKRNVIYHLNQKPSPNKDEPVNNLNKRSKDIIYWFER